MNYAKQKLWYNAKTKVEEARKSLCDLNDAIDQELRLIPLQHRGEKQAMHLKKASKSVDKAFDGFSGFPGIEVDLNEGGF